MKNRTTTLLALLLAFVTLTGLLACGGAEAPQEGEGITAEDVPLVDEEEMDAVKAEAAVDSVTLGTQLGAAGAIATGHASSEFAVGESVFLAMEVDDATAGEEVQVVWYGPDGLELGSDSAVVEQGQETLSFSTDTVGWNAGSYRGEVWYDDELVEEFEFELTGAPEGPEAV